MTLTTHEHFDTELESDDFSILSQVITFDCGVGAIPTEVKEHYPVITK